MHYNLWTRGFIYEQEHGNCENGLETVMHFVDY